MDFLPFMLGLLAVIAIVDLGLRAAAKLNGRSIPFFMPVWADAPEYENERFNWIDNVLQYTVIPVAAVAGLLGLIALYADYDLAGFVLICLGGLGLNSRVFFLEWCLGFAELAEDSAPAQTLTS
jgi:hypothetical protein